MVLQFDITRMEMLKDIMSQLRKNETPKLIAKLTNEFSDVGTIDFLLTIQTLLNSDDGLTIKDAEKLFDIYPHLFTATLNVRSYHLGHPAHIFQQENKTFHMFLRDMHHLLNQLENELDNAEVIQELKHLTFRLGEFHKHYHRKEKLFFPIMERYGHYHPIRFMWRWDDRIRALFQGVKRQITHLPQIDIKNVRVMYDKFANAFEDMLFQEDMIILPVLLELFQEADWLAIAKESDAFGYVTTDLQAEWEVASQSDAFVSASAEYERGEEMTDDFTTKNIPFGGGYLTPEEANLVLNHLPLEITFVDKNSVFKYFNTITKASDMILVRTPISIGRNVANCHPPKSLHKVMTLVRDLKTKKRSSESMWFKKKDEYVHITYKALFNEADEYMGILEYVQDIQHFFNLPSEIKRGLSPLDA